MKDRTGRVIYVGKARSLKKRVSSYFTKSHSSPKTGLLVAEIKGIDYVPANSEAEALIYEASLIKSRRPRFNIELKDGKSYPYLKLTLNEAYPRLFITRRKIDDGARYYGPYTNVKLLKDALSFMKTLFPLRTCKRLGKKLCMSYQLSECLGPCAGKRDKKRYHRVVEELLLFLEGKRQRLIKGLSRRMEETSRKLNFEEAARIRNRIRALSTLVTKRGVPGPMDQIDELKYVLDLKRRPKRIEAFDISNIRGKEAVGSMVSFYDGKPDKNNYRKFKIRTVEGVDDYKMMREVVFRRYRRLLDEKRGLPDLIIIDGGKGHLTSAIRELKKLNIRHIPAIGIAKEFEHIYVPARRLPIVLAGDSSILQLIRRIRDEAHRFARAYHTGLRRSGITISELDNIKGIGPIRKSRLLNTFGSVKNVKKAALKDLLKVRGIDEKRAKDIIRYFRKKRL
ncbi:MAG: excinuclease ABC subunit UvrC [Candidatus Omnitrophica bacterium]|nr:excinuclease ABC subunit UvrC [Candidatus Omnitrophota bacterium]